MAVCASTDLSCLIGIRVRQRLAGGCGCCCTRGSCKMLGQEAAGKASHLLGAAIRILPFLPPPLLSACCSKLVEQVRAKNYVPRLVRSLCGSRFQHKAPCSLERGLHYRRDAFWNDSHCCAAECLQGPTTCGSQARTNTGG